MQRRDAWGAPRTGIAGGHSVASMRLLTTMAGRLAIWALRGIARPLLVLAVFLVAVYVVVGRQDGMEDSGVPRPDGRLESVLDGSHAGRLESRMLARVNCALVPREPCERYAAFAADYEAWRARAWPSMAGVSTDPEAASVVANAERRAGLAVRRRAFDEAIQELRTARSVAEALLVTSEVAADPGAAVPARSPPTANLATRPGPVGGAVEPLSVPARPEISGESLEIAPLSDEADRLVPVTVVSDQATLVLIRGIRALGRIDRTIVTLPPGTYVFQGHREGYRTIRVEVDVAADTDVDEVVIKCDQRL